MIYLATLLFSLFLTIALIPFFRRVAVHLQAFDMPNERKVHPYPIPRSGGIAMAIGIFIPVMLWVPGGAFIRSILMGTGIVVLFGLIDDFKDLNYRIKFAGQIAAALVVIFYGGLKITSLGMLLPDEVLLPDWLAIPLTLIVIVGVTNAINFADGLDGLAGGICILSFLCTGFLAYQCGNIDILILSIAVVGAIFGFLRFNTFPAELFMGDAGSQMLGFMAITLLLGLTQANTPLSPLMPLVLLGFPILDTLYVMLSRIVRGQSPFVPDKNHFHHKLMSLGFYHTESVFIIYVLQSVLVVAAFLLRFHSDWLLLSLYLVFAGAVLAGIAVAGRSGWQVARYDFVDIVVKGKLQRLRGKKLPIKISFRAVNFGLPALLIFACCITQDVPNYLTLSSLGFILLIGAFWFLKREWLIGALRACLYASIPFIVYISESNMVSWMDETPLRLYNLTFVVLAFLVLVTLKFTRRKKGFKGTPMDFLIIFFALVIPNLSDQGINNYHLGMLAAKIIAFLFSYEVLIGELRGEYNKLAVWTVVAMGVVVLKGTF